MASFLTLPIFPFEVDWSAATAKRWAYDVREATLGFGREFIDPIADDIVRGYDLTVYLPDAPAVGGWESWWMSRAVVGNVFWLPELRQHSEVAAPVDTTHFDVPHPYFEVGDALWLVDPQGVGSARSVIGIIGVGANFRITIDPLAIAPGWQVHRLLRVRLATDKLEVRWLAANRAMSKIRLVEVPGSSLGTVEEQPLWLYQFTGVSETFYFTSHQADVVYAGQTWSAVPITHGSIREALSGDKNECAITTSFFPENPLSSRVPFADASPLSVQILRLARNQPGAEKLFVGRIGAVSLDGNQLSAKATTERAIFKSQFPQFYLQNRCNHVLFGTACGLAKTAWDSNATISDLNRNRLVVTGAGITGKPADWFANGYVESGDELMACTKSLGDTLWLAAPLRRAEIGDVITAYAGCSKAGSICDSKFNNFGRFGGHPKIPRENLTLKTIEYDAGTPVAGK